MQLTRLFDPTLATRPGAVALLIAISVTPLFGQAVPKASYEANGSFQLPGKGQPGAPDRPQAMALGPGGTVHIADGKGLIFVFDSAGLYRRTYGQAELDNPVAIDVTSQNIAYVLDSSRKRVYVFGPGGQALRTISSSGGKGGQLSAPVDMALGPAGFLYVLDSGRRGVQIFSLDGLFVRDVPFNDNIRDPQSLALGNDGTIYIADGNTRDHIFALPPFTQLPWAGTIPSGIAGHVNLRGAQLSDPVATAVNEFGTVVVLDQKTGRLWRRNAGASQPIGPNDMLYGGSGTGRGSFKRAEDVVYSGREHLLILDGDQRKVERIRLTTESGLSAHRDFRFPVRVTNVPRSLPRPLLDVVYSADGRPVFLMAVEGRAISMMGTQVELHETVYGDSVPAYLPDPTVLQVQFSQEIGRVAGATATESNVLVVDSRRNRFAVFGLEGGAPQGMYGDNYQDNRKLKSPSGMAVLPDGRIVIADTGNDRVKVFSADLASLAGSFEFRKPAGVAVAPDGEVYAWSEDGTQVGRLMSADGTFEQLGATLLTGPVAAITFDQAGNLFLLDRENHRITIVDDDLSKVWIQLGAEGAFDRPDRITVDREGNIYVSDSGAGLTAEYRWDVDFPPLAGFDLIYEGESAVLTWQPGPPGFIRGYEIQGADQIGGPWVALARTEAPPFRVDPEARSEDPPRYVRVAPVYITGVRGRPTASLPLAYFTANAAYQRGEYDTALRESSEGLRLQDMGLLDASDEARGRLLYLAFASAYALGDFTQAVDFAQELITIQLPRERLIPFLFQLAEIYIRSGDPEQASHHILTLVGQGPREEYYRDPAVLNQSFLIYHRLRQSGNAADALEFIRLYTQSIPATVQELKDEYTDSIIVFSTRDRLGPGFEYWANADYGAVVTFYEQLITEGGLTIEQAVVGRQVLAVAYYAFGRRVDAEDTFREIFNLRPQFDLEREVPRIRSLYGLVIYNPETRRFFAALTPRS